MEALQELDQVAYVRFASVYRNFREAKDFEAFLGELGGTDGRADAVRRQPPLGARRRPSHARGTTRSAACSGDIAPYARRPGARPPRPRQCLAEPGGRLRAGASDGRVIGRGWTQPGGRPHAETEALRRAGAAARGATAYVTLEPCSHHGRTPPCCDALIAAGVARVVVAMRDPDPRVNGRGLALLRDAGIEVEDGLLEAEARALNAGFFRRIEAGLPLVTLKLATTLDGRIATATGESRWITGAEARREAHAMRARHDAILVGSGTVLADDPDLTCRIPGMERVPMLRVVADARLRTPADRAAGRHRHGGADLHRHHPRPPAGRPRALHRRRRRGADRAGRRDRARPARHARRAGAARRDARARRRRRRPRRRAAAGRAGRPPRLVPRARP